MPTSWVMSLKNARDSEGVVWFASALTEIDADGNGSMERGNASWGFNPSSQRRIYTYAVAVEYLPCQDSRE